MPIIYKTIEEYTLKRGKKSFWMCFNIPYNEIYAFKNTKDYDSHFDIDKKHTDNQAKEEFLNFMQENFPNVKLESIFDCWDSGWLIFPYLGSVAIDCDEGDEVYEMIDKRYSDENGAPKSANAVFWYMSLEVAQRLYKERKKAFELSFDLDSQS